MQLRCVLMHILHLILCVCVRPLHGKCVVSKSYKPMKIMISKAENEKKLGQEVKRRNKMQVD